MKRIFLICVICVFMLAVIGCGSNDGPLEVTPDVVPDTPDTTQPDETPVDEGVSDVEALGKLVEESNPEDEIDSISDMEINPDDFLI